MKNDPTSSGSITIIGGGWSGAATTLHLLRKGTSPLRIHWITGPDSPGLGLAFGTSDAVHRLNVPATKMSIDPTDPGDFVRFAVERGHGGDPFALHPRLLHGQYVQQRLQAATDLFSGELNRHPERAVRVERTSTGWRVTLDTGVVLETSEVVLATGHGPMKVPEALQPFVDHAALFADPWVPGAFDEAARSPRLLVVGTGLTAVDVLLSLDARGRTASVTVTSRHGYWPGPHLPEVHWDGPDPGLDPADAPRTADGLATWLEEHIAGAATRDIPWQAVMGAIRPHISTLWKTLAHEESSRFLTEHRSCWEVVRHRLPADTHASIMAWREEGRIRERIGGLDDVRADGDALVVTFSDGGEETFDGVLLATGNASDPRTFPDPLWESLIRDGLVQPCPLGLGVLTDDTDTALDAAGRPSGLLVVGGLQRPRLLESSAVPDLSPQAERVAATLLARFPG